jgi:hypothetical protein
MKTHAQRPVEINIFDFQVSHFLRSRSGVIEHHEESPVTQREDSIARQGPEEDLDFVVFQVYRLRGINGSWPAIPQLSPIENKL